MKENLKSLAAIAVLTAFGLALPALAAPGVGATRTMEAMSADQADAKAKQDLLSLLHATTHFEKGMFQTIRGISLQTSPHGAGFAGLCTRDRMLLHYSPTTGKGQAVDRPLKVSGFESQHLFHVLKAPLIDIRDEGPERTTWNPECATTTVEKATAWFPAHDGTEAAKVINMIALMQTEVKSGRLKFESCKSNASLDCGLAILGKATFSEIDGITPCYAPPYHACYDVTFGGSLGLRIKAMIEDDSIMPERIDEIADWDFVTVT